VVENLKSFNGKVIIQTLFLHGSFRGEIIDNTTEEELSEWLKLIAEIKPLAGNDLHYRSRHPGNRSGKGEP